jgi:hypothetical protein
MVITAPDFRTSLQAIRIEVTGQRRVALDPRPSLRYFKSSTIHSEWVTVASPSR